MGTTAWLAAVLPLVLALALPPAALAQAPGISDGVIQVASVGVAPPDPVSPTTATASPTARSATSRQLYGFLNGPPVRLVRFDPATGEQSDVAILGHDVAVPLDSAAYDPVRNRYVALALGMPSAGQTERPFEGMVVISVDLASRVVTRGPPIPTADDMFGIEVDPADGMLYGLRNDTPTMQTAIVRLDGTLGTTRTIATVSCNGVPIEVTTFDPRNRLYMFACRDQLVTVDVRSESSTPQFGPSIGDGGALEIDRDGNALYKLALRSGSLALQRIDLETGQVDNRRVFNQSGWVADRSTFDPDARLYVTSTTAPRGQRELVAVHVDSGEVAWRRVAPEFFGLESGVSPSDTATHTATPTRTRTATRTVTGTATPSRTSTSVPTVTPRDTATGTRTATRTATRTRTRTPTPTRTRTLTRTITPTRTRTLTRTTTVTRTPRPPTLTRTTAPTRTRTLTRTITPTRTRTLTRTITPTRTRTLTPTITATRTRTITPTRSVTLTRTATRTRTATMTRTPSRTRTATPTRTATVTPTAEVAIFGLEGSALSSLGTVLAADAPPAAARVGAPRVTGTRRSLAVPLARGESATLEAGLSVDRPIEAATLRAVDRGWLAIDPGSAPSRLEPGRIYTIRLTATMPGTTGQAGTVALVPADGRALGDRLVVRLVPRG